MKRDITDIIEAKLIQLMLERIARPAPYITITSDQAAGYKERVIALKSGKIDIKAEKKAKLKRRKESQKAKPKVRESSSEWSSKSDLKKETQPVQKPRTAAKSLKKYRSIRVQPDLDLQPFLQKENNQIKFMQTQLQNTNMFHLLPRKEDKTQEMIKLGWSQANTGYKVENQMKNVLYHADKNKQAVSFEKTVNTCPLLKSKYKNKIISEVIQ
jgi:hypothetical protein